VNRGPPRAEHSSSALEQDVQEGETMHITRRGLQLGLGGLWVLDGALQLQPVMFTSTFAREIIAPAGAGQPGPVHWEVSLAAAVIGHSPVVFDALFAAVQLAIGAGLLWQRTVRVALGGSVTWALGVWVMGEGLGRVLAPGASLLTGAPGAALLYAVLAVAAWPSSDPEAAAVPAGWLPMAWVAIWAGTGLLGLVSGGSSGGSIAGSLESNLAGMPSTLSSVSRSLAHLVASAGPLAGTALGVLLVLAGAGALWPGRSRTLAAGLGAVLALFTWIFAEGFGGIPSGQGTDPNTGPLLVLLAAAVWSVPPLGQRARSVAASRRRLPAPTHSSRVAA
jgi:hypothetical protein